MPQLLFVCLVVGISFFHSSFSRASDNHFNSKGAFSQTISSLGPEPLRHLCEGALNPHFTFSVILPQISDEMALSGLKANYSELMNWLSKKATHSPEGDNAPKRGYYGPNGESPSMFLFSEQIKEIDRTAVGFLALKWILADDYDSFTRNQEPTRKMKLETFQSLRSYILTHLPNPESVDAMIVSMVLNDLGKVQRFSMLMERALLQIEPNHDRILFTAINEWPEIPASFERLSESFRHLIVRSLAVGSDLNVAQLAQGENLPYHLHGINGMSEKEFHFHMIHLILDVAGANGATDSGGSMSLTEPVFQGYRTASQVLSQVGGGSSSEDIYNAFLDARSKQIDPEGELNLSSADPSQRMILRLSLMRRAVVAEDMAQIIHAFESLPTNAREILLSEFNVSGNEEWGSMLYYAPSVFVNALKNIDENSPENRQIAIREIMLSFARISQLARIELRGRSGAGVMTINVWNLAEYVKRPEFAQDPKLLSQIQFSLSEADPTKKEMSLEITPLPEISPSRFSNLHSLADLQGTKFVIIGMGGGSDIVQAKILGKLLKKANKSVTGLISVRAEKIGSQSQRGQVGEPRGFGNAEVLYQGVFRVNERSFGQGQAFEPLLSQDDQVIAVLDPGNKTLKERLTKALVNLPAASGGASLATGELTTFWI